MRKNQVKSTGYLITFEGGEGAGKTTQVKLLAASLEKAGYQVLIAREPGSTQIAEQIRAIILSPENEQMAALTELLLYQAARAQVYTQVVLPALKAGKIVLMDRSIDSSVVYQGMVRQMGTALVEQLNDIATLGRRPNLTFILDVPVEVGFGRIARRSLDRLEQAGEKFHQQVRQGYLSLLQKQPQEKRFVLIDGARSLTEIHQQVNKLVQQLCGRKK